MLLKQFELISIEEAFEIMRVKDLSKKEKKIYFKKDISSLKAEFNSYIYKNVLSFIKSENIFSYQEVDKFICGKDLLVFFIDGKFYKGNSFLLINLIQNHLINEIIQVKKILEFDTVVDLGCGYGSKLLSIINSGIIDKKEIIGLDISKTCLEILDLIALNNQLDLKTILCDFSKSNFQFFNRNSRKIVYSSYSLHYIHDFSLSFIEKLLDTGFVGGIHLEPCYEFMRNLKNQTYRNICLNYMIWNDYNKNIGSVFLEAEKKGLISINISKKIFGSNFLPAWTINWRSCRNG